MYLKDLFARKKGATLSFEIFPPKKNIPMDTIFTTIEGLSNLKPDFISVTYGAGGAAKTAPWKSPRTLNKTRD